MRQLFFGTDNTWAGMVLRLTLGFIMFPHGAQKMFGLFGGYGFKGTMNYFTGSMKLPGIIAFLVIVIECFCSIGLILGLSSRLCAFLFITIMIGAIITTNQRNGLFMNWSGSQKGEGYEYHLLVIGIAIALIFTGSGVFSLDGIICRVR
jgi:putative oxidoreductase